MIIHCDACGAEIAKEGALPFQADKGEVFYFCDKECLSKCRHLTPVEPPDREERGVGSQVEVELDDETE